MAMMWGMGQGSAELEVESLDETTCDTHITARDVHWQYWVFGILRTAPWRRHNHNVSLGESDENAGAACRQAIVEEP